MYIWSPQAQAPTSMHLDRTSSPTESAIRQRREATNLCAEGIEVASSIRHYDTSSASYFGSKTSMTGSDNQGYYSSSQPPDEMYESSDYRVGVVSYMIIGWVWLVILITGWVWLVI